MSRGLLWLLCLGVALLTHAGLLLIPLPDDPLVAGSPAAEISVHLLDTPVGSVKSAPTEKASLLSASAIKKTLVEMPAKQATATEQVLKPKSATEQSRVQPSPQAKNVPVQKIVKPQATAVAAVAPAVEPVTAAKPAEEAVEQDALAEKTATGKQPPEVAAALPAAKPQQQVARAVSQRKPKYPRRAIVRNQEGSVRVELLIRTDGRVEQAVLLESSGYPLLDKSVMDFVEKEQFYATLDKGVPVASKQLFTYRFVLN